MKGKVRRNWLHVTEENMRVRMFSTWDQTWCSVVTKCHIAMH